VVILLFAELTIKRKMSLRVFLICDCWKQRELNVEMVVDGKKQTHFQKQINVIYNTRTSKIETTEIEAAEEWGAVPVPLGIVAVT